MRKVPTAMINAVLTALVFLQSTFALVMGAPAAAAAGGTPLPPVDFMAQVMTAIQGMGGVSTMVKISVIVTLVIASMKVTVLNKLVWAKLGEAQVWVAPVLGLVAGILGLGASGAPLTLALVFAYVSAGGGAVFLHELLDSLKAVPGLGDVYVTAIGIIEKALGGSQPNPVVNPITVKDSVLK